MIDDSLYKLISLVFALVLTRQNLPIDLGLQGYGRVIYGELNRAVQAIGIVCGLVGRAHEILDKR
jgi:hypothetical protein